MGFRARDDLEVPAGAGVDIAVCDGGEAGRRRGFERDVRVGHEVHVVRAARVVAQGAGAAEGVEGLEAHLGRWTGRSVLAAWVLPVVASGGGPSGGGMCRFWGGAGDNVEREGGGREGCDL